MTAAGLRISEVNGWRPEDLGLETASLGRLVTKLDGLMQSMLIEQDDLAESWNGAGADAAARRVVNEKTAGSHVSGKIDGIKSAVTFGQTELQDAKSFVLTKRTNFVTAGFEVDDRGIVTANEKVKQISAAGGDRGAVMAAGFAVMAEAGRYTLEMLEALQHAQGVANGVQTKLVAAKSELSNLVIQEAPSKVLRMTGLAPGQTSDGAQPSIFTPLTAMHELEEGRPVEVTTPDGRTLTLKPPENGGPPSLIESTVDPDGTIHTKTQNPDGTVTAAVSTPRADGSGIIDTVVTSPDGTTTKLEQVPKPGGVTETYSVGPNGRNLVSTSTPLPDNRGVMTESKNGDQVTRAWTAPNGATVTYTNIIGPDGQEQLVGVSNSAGYKGIVGADGSVDMQFGEGKWAKLTQQPDGTVLVGFSDGSVLQTTPPPPGQSPVKPWDVVQSWTESVAGNNPISGTISGAQQHPYATVGGMGASGIAEGMTQGGKSLAQEAAMLGRTSQLLGEGALQDLANSSSAPGKQAAIAMQIGDEATKIGSHADMLAKAGKIGGPVATIGFSAYTSWDDWKHGKDGWEATGAGVGSAAGGIAAGAALGALGGSWAGPPGAIVGAIIGGVAGGGAGGWVGENTVKAVK